MFFVYEHLQVAVTRRLQDALYGYLWAIATAASMRPQRIRLKYLLNPRTHFSQRAEKFLVPPMRSS